MNLYFYGGSFDPPHLGHKKIINYFYNSCDKLLVVPAFKSPHKSCNPISFFHRREMLKIMLKDLSDKSIILNYENKNSIRYTFETIQFLKKKYPNHLLNMILGADQFKVIDSWKNYEYILNNVKLSVILRPGYKLNINEDGVNFVSDINLDISSKDIKNNIDDINKIKSMIDEEVLNYIIKNNLYR